MGWKLQGRRADVEGLGDKWHWCSSCEIPKDSIKKLDVTKMKEAAKYFEGEHDFKGFKATGGNNKSTVRTIYSAEIIYEPKTERIVIELVGNGFLYNMVRIIAGTLVEVGLNKILPSEITDIINSKDRTRAGKTLPAHGLYLVEVFY